MLPYIHALHSLSTADRHKGAGWGKVQSHIYSFLWKQVCASCFVVGLWLSELKEGNGLEWKTSRRDGSASPIMSSPTTKPKVREVCSVNGSANGYLWWCCIFSMYVLNNKNMFGKKKKIGKPLRSLAFFASANLNCSCSDKKREGFAVWSHFFCCLHDAQKS